MCILKKKQQHKSSLEHAKRMKEERRVIKIKEKSYVNVFVTNSIPYQRRVWKYFN